MEVEILLTSGDIEAEFVMKIDMNLTLDQIRERAIEHLREKLQNCSIRINYDPDAQGK